MITADIVAARTRQRMNSHREKRRCECGECGGLETRDYYIQGGRYYASECWERLKNRQSGNSLGEPIRRKWKAL